MRRHPHAKLSIIAHSFGTYIIGQILKRGFDLHIHRLILCGSVLPAGLPVGAVPGAVRQGEGDQRVRQDRYLAGPGPVGSVGATGPRARTASVPSWSRTATMRVGTASISSRTSWRNPGSRSSGGASSRRASTRSRCRRRRGGSRCSGSCRYSGVYCSCSQQS